MSGYNNTSKTSHINHIISQKKNSKHNIIRRFSKACLSAVDICPKAPANKKKCEIAPIVTKAGDAGVSRLKL